jgi:hypothetical protein
MERNMTISGFNEIEAGKGYELWTHGGEAKGEAICAFSYDIHHIPEALVLIKMMRRSLKEAYEGECEAVSRRLYGERLNDQLMAAGHKPFTQEEIDIVYDSHI